MDGAGPGLVLIAGLGTDERLFDAQREAFPGLIAPRWLAPRPREGLAEYAERFAAEIRPRRPFVLGGCSLGGMIAHEMAHFLRPDALVLISTAVQRRAIPLHSRLLGRLAWMLPPGGYKFGKQAWPRLVSLFQKSKPEHRRLVVAMARDASPSFLRWACMACGRWQPRPPANVPTFLIHGEHDWVLPLGNRRADFLIRGARHLIPLTHVAEVNAALRQIVDRVAQAAGALQPAAQVPAHRCRAIIEGVETSEPNLVLISGMGADERLFAAQRAAFPQLVTPAWIPPRPREGLADYARRLAADVPTARPLVLGGCSLGGMLAGEMAHVLRPDALVLIASVADHRAIPLHFRALARIAWTMPEAGYGFGKRVFPHILSYLRGRKAEHRRLVTGMARDTSSHFLRWTCMAVGSWRAPPPADVPTYVIHGDRDRILPLGNRRADFLIRGAGHVITITHAGEVNAALREIVARVARDTNAQRASSSP